MFNNYVYVYGHLDRLDGLNAHSVAKVTGTIDTVLKL